MLRAALPLRGPQWTTLAALVVLSLPPTTALGPLRAAEVEPPATVRGRVTDEAGVPLAGATVRLLRQGLSWERREMQPESWVDPLVVASDAEGTFAADLPPGTEHAVRVEAPGRAPTTVERIPAGAWVSLHVEPGHALGGRVVAAPEGAPLPGATIVACDAQALVFGPDACQSVATDETGTFRIDGLPEGVVQLRAHAPGRAASAVLALALPARYGPEPLLRLGPGARVRGRVIDENGRPVPGARLYARELVAPAGPHGASADEWPEYAASDGTFDLEGLPAGRRFGLLAYRADRGVADGGSVQLDAGADLEGLEIRLPASAALALRLVDEEGAAVEAFEILYRESGPTPGEHLGPLEPWRVERGSEGRVTARIPREGTFDLRFAPAGSREIDVPEVTLAPGRTTDLGTLVVSSGASVRGRVMDDADAPIPHATVEASWSAGGIPRTKRALADAAGHYALSGLTRAAVRVEASAPGFVAAGVDGVVPDAEDVDLRLSPTGGLAGRVRLDEGGVPPAFLVVVHAEARAPEAGEAEPPRKETFVDEDGAWRIADLASGRYSIEVRAEGRATGRRSGIRVESGAITDVGTLELGEGLVLRGRVLAAVDDGPVAGAEIAASRAGGSLLAASAERRFAATTDEDGRFALEGLEPGSHIVAASHPAFAPAEERAEITEGTEPEELVQRLAAGGILTGVVRDATGRPAPGRRLIVARDLSRADDLPSADTDAEGRYELTRLAPGSYVVSLAPAPGAALRLLVKNAAIRDGEITRLDFDEASPITLEGFALRDGQPLAGAQLFFSKSFELTDFRFASTDEAGWFEIGLDAPGRYRVMLDAAAGGASTDIDVPDTPRSRQDVRFGGDGIGGRVADAAGRAVAGAVVSAGPAGGAGTRLLVAETGADGRYAIAGLAAGPYRLTAAAPGFRIGVQAVEVVAGGEPIAADFTLERGGALSGRVLDGFGNGIGGAAVLAAPAGVADAWGAGAATAVTDVNGAFLLTSPGDGPLDLAALPPAWAPALLTGVVPGDDEIVLRASRGGQLRVLVVDAGGAPRAGSSVAARRVPPFLGSELVRLLTPPPVTDAEGIARIPNLAPGSYEVVVTGARAPALATVAEELETLLRVELP